MNLWTMEWARLLRTRRLLAVVAPYVFFGLLGPLTARYLEDLLQRFGQGVMVDVPEPTPVDGIVQFSSNAGQIGLLVALVVAAGALAIDAQPQIATFLRTRVPSARRLLIPRYVVSTAGVCVAFTIGVSAAWYQTAVLLGPLPAGGMIAGTLYGWLYLAVAVAVVAAAASLVRSRLAAVALSVVVLLALPVLGLLPPLQPWLPSELVGALDQLAAGAPAGDFSRAAVTAAATTIVLLALAAWRLERREI